MDNVIQNISIEDIIPSKFQPTKEEKIKIEELAQLIKEFGLIDPILVRQKNNKYEIILGTDKYQAALKAQLETVPVIIKEVDDEVYSKYSNIDNYNRASPQSLSINKISTEKVNNNSDIINLSELSKIKIEYERDDVKMNNEQLNNIVQPAMNQSNQGPTFGDKFFPSLEDQPTNMNMMGNMTPPAQPEIPNLGPTPSMNSNLIDLTDLSNDQETNQNVNLGIPTTNIPNVEVNPTMNNNTMPQDNIGAMVPETPTIAQSNDNIINLDSLQNNNPVVQPISEPVSMDILHEDFGAPAQTPPQIDIPQAPQEIAPSQPMNIVQPEITPNVPSMISSEPSMINPQPSIDINTAPTMNTDLGAPVIESTPAQPMMDMNNEPTIPNDIVVPTPEISGVTPPKDITPVTSTIRNLVSSLGTFGYNINITEEDLSTSAKIIIEIEK